MTSGLLIAFLLSAGLLVLFRRWADALGFIDRPNERSSHSRPMPVGGGICFAIAITVVLTIQSLGSQATGEPPWVLCIAGISVASVGLIDDRWGLPVWPRMFLYAGAAGAVVSLYFELFPPWGVLPLVLGVTWLINLVNFMDGSDGLVATQVMAVCAGMASIGFFMPDAGSLVALALLMMSALLPFLWLNWPPATLFMGDSGAVFMGLYLGALGFESWQVSERMGYAWLALMMPFLVDSGFTLLARGVRGRSLFLAHREHAYQRFLRDSDSPLLVVLGLLAIHGIWQFPCALIIVQSSYSPEVAVFFSTIPSLVVVTYLWLRK